MDSIQNEQSVPKSAIWSFFLLVVMSLLLLVITPGFAQASENLSAVKVQAIGSINGQPIMEADFMREVGLREAVNEAAGNPAPINKIALLDWMVQDIILRQVAMQAGVTVEDAAVQAEIGMLIAQIGVTADDFLVVLDNHGLTWDDFETVIRNYMVVNRFIEEYLLTGVPDEQRQAFFQNWLTTQADASTIDFDEVFLNSLIEQ